jgi:hypothetical protein
MNKEATESQVLMAICYRTMSSWNFDYHRRLEWEVWAAKHQPCPGCPANTGEQCVNLVDVRLNKFPRRLNKRPHDERVDWARLLSGLKQRGYYRASIETIVRRELG